MDNNEDYSTEYVKSVLEECISSGRHLTACNEDGSCAFCSFGSSYQEDKFEEDWD